MEQRSTDNKVIILEMKRVTLAEMLEGAITAKSVDGYFTPLEEYVVNREILRLVVDLSEIDFILAVGFRRLIDLLLAAKNSGGDVRLVQPSPKVAESLELTGLAPLFRVFSTQVDAVGSF